MILRRIEAYMRQHHMPPTRFGREALGDPNLVAQLRDGRELRSRTEQRVLDYLARREAPR
jgi:2,4-dienoyl-CoA reductase-like NADH-dependent reductase (Old Yellow Enzyme family)